jgi:hypothetical protein
MSIRFDDYSTLDIANVLAPYNHTAESSRGTPSRSGTAIIPSRPRTPEVSSLKVSNNQLPVGLHQILARVLACETTSCLVVRPLAFRSGAHRSTFRKDRTRPDLCDATHLISQSQAQKADTSEITSLHFTCPTPATRSRSDFTSHASRLTSPLSRAPPERQPTYMIARATYPSTKRSRGLSLIGKATQIDLAQLYNLQV